MKLHKFLLIPFFLINLSLGAQSRYGAMLPKSAIKAANTRSGSIYVGIDNPLLVNIKSSRCSNYVIKTNNGIVYNQNDTLFLMPKRSGKIRLQLYETCGSDTINHGYLFLSAELMPVPKLIINQYIIDKNASMSKSFLLNADSIKVFISDDILGANSWSQVIQYELGYSFGGYFLSFTNEGSVLNSEAKEFISKISPNKELSLKAKISGEGKIIKALPLYRINIY